MLWKIVLLILTFVLVSCAATPSGQPTAWIDVGTIIANPAQYDGKQVTIKGWAYDWHDDYGIWATQDDYRKRNRKNCISLLNYYKDDALNETVDRKEVLVTGIFYRDAYHDKDGRPVVLLGSCSQFGIQFSEPEGLRRFFN